MNDEIMRPVQDMESGVGFGRLVPADMHHGQVHKRLIAADMALSFSASTRGRESRRIYGINRVST